LPLLDGVHVPATLRWLTVRVPATPLWRPVQGRLAPLVLALVAGCALTPPSATGPPPDGSGAPVAARVAGAGRGAEQAATGAAKAGAKAPRVGAATLADGESRASLRTAVDEAMPVLSRRAARPDATAGTRRAARSLQLLGEALAAPEGSFDAALLERFSVPAASEVFVTGYHEPTLTARRSRDARFRHPIYRMPQGGGALPTRAEIDAGALSGRGLELFWVDDPIELFFLHVQGSGRLELDDGSVVRIGYAGSNGKTYRAIGAVLVERGVLRREEATAPAIKAYLRAHPGEAPAILRENPRYVFFQARAARAEQGPRGALDVPLVPYRSVAVDPALVPLGSIGHLRVPLPTGETFSALVVAMDTGTAIKGPGRIDLFCGPDERAARIAGELRHPGQLVWLEPRS